MGFATVVANIYRYVENEFRWVFIFEVVIVGVCLADLFDFAVKILIYSFIFLSIYIFYFAGKQFIA